MFSNKASHFFECWIFKKNCYLFLKFHYHLLQTVITFNFQSVVINIIAEYIQFPWKKIKDETPI